MNNKVAIIGAGGFGISLAVTLNKYNNDIILYSVVKEEIEQLKANHESKKLLPGIAVDNTIALTTEPNDLADCDLIILAVASKFIKSTALIIKDYIKKTAVVANVAKGFCDDMRLSEVLSEHLTNDIVILSGPSHAEEIARGVPTTIVASSNNRKSAEYVQSVMINTNLRIYVNDDMVGVELGGALKNIIALCAGVIDGLQLGDNTKAALMTRGLTEIARLGKEMGASFETFAGLAGMGDLIVTCTSMHSRNRRCGILIGEGLSPQDAIERVGMTVEGYEAAKSAYNLSQKYNVDMPITTEIYNVLYKGKDMKQALNDLMTRPRRHENEEVWLLEQ